MRDLQNLAPEELFDEIPQKPTCELESVEYSLYESQCPELLGNFMLELLKNGNGEYFMVRKEREPIGDYGSRWVDYWYKCNNNDILNAIL